MWMKRDWGKLRKAWRCAFFLIGLICMSTALANVLVSKASGEKMTTFFEKNEDFDVLFTGLSHMQSGIHPLELWNDYGITSFNLAESGNYMPSDYWLIKNALNYTTPKLLVIDIRKMDLQEIRMDNYVYSAWDMFPASYTKYLASLELFSTWDERLEFLFPFIRYHSRWTELTRTDFKGAKYRSDYRIDMGTSYYNYCYKGKPLVAAPVTVSMLPESEQEMGSDLCVQYLMRLLDLCSSKGIQVLLVEMPYPADEHSQKLANGIADIAEKNNVNYINFLHTDVVDFTTDMYDEGHLNDSGARKVTRYLGEYITTHYDIPDRRTGETYISWKESFNEFLAFKEKRLQTRDALKDYLMLLADKDFSCCIYLSSAKKILQDQQIRALLDNIPVMKELLMTDDADLLSDSLLWIIDNKDRKALEARDGLMEVDTSFGHVSYGIDEKQSKYLYIQNEESNYLEKDADIVIVALDNITGEMVDSACFVINSSEEPALSFSRD